MSNGAISVHKAIRTELENYIQSQYFGKSMLLLNAVQPELDKEGLLYKRPYIESSPAYKSSPDGIEKSDIPDWMKGYFKALINAGIEGPVRDAEISTFGQPRTSRSRVMIER